MSENDEISKRACEFVERLLRRRLRLAGIPQSLAPRSFECEPQAPRPWARGTEVRVRVWRHWSDARVEHDEERGDTLRWTLDRLVEPASEQEMELEDAVRAAQECIKLPEDAELDAFFHFQLARNTKVACLRLKRVVDGMRVDGDCLELYIHPQTRRVIDFFRKWRDLDLK